MREESLTNQPDRPLEKEARPISLSTQFPLILGDLPDGVTVQDRTGRLVYANAAAARSSGYSSVEAMLAAPVGHFLERFELFAEDGAPFPTDRLPGRRALRGEVAAETTLRVRDRLSGALSWSTIKAIPILDEQGNVQFAINIFQDITARKRAEEALRFLLQASELLHESLDYQDTLTRLAHLVVPGRADWCGVDIVEEDGTLRRLAVAHTDPAKVRWAAELQRRYPPDPQAPVGVPRVIRTGESELFAQIPDEMLRRVARDAVHLELLRTVGVRSALIVPLATRDRILGAISLVAAESGRQYDRADLSLAEDLGRRAAAAIENARLFREVQRAREEIEIQAEELEATAAQLEAANEELRARTDEAEAANRAKSQFLAMMSHELRTPLNAVAGYTELLEMEIHGPLTAAQREDLRKIRVSQNHLLTIINDVLSFAKLETGHLSFAIEEVPLAPMLAELVDLVEPLLRAKEQHYEHSCASPSLSVLADPEKLRQILLNLLANATKFTAGRGRISVRCEARAREIEIRVQDTGRGIPPDRLQAVFEPFVQVDPGLTREVSGIGLGLTISRDLARAMGGDLRAESRVNQGSTFFLTLPRGTDVAPRVQLAPVAESR